MKKLSKKFIAIPAITLAAGFGLAACGTTAHTVVVKPAVTVTAPAPKPSASTSSAAAPAPKVIVVKPAPAKTVYVQPAAPAAPAPAQLSGTNCGADQNGYGVHAGPNTSCSFALNVAADYNGAAYDAGPQVETVYSPVTGQNYSMTYTWSDGVVTATGGNDASVQFVG